MDAAVGFLSALFWGLLTLSVLVFIHEGGHFLAARACGVRVTEFFLGLPCSKNIHRVSKRIGTKFGVTPILLGGYAAVSGMEDARTPCAAAVLSAVHRHGTVSTAQLAAELGESEEDVQEACAMLVGWGSLACAYEPDEDRRYYPASFASVPRDAAGRTLFDGRRFDREHATAEGEPWEPMMGERAFLEQERAATYAGKGFWSRALILVAGILVNVVCGMLLIMSVYSVIGVSVAVDTNVIGAVAEGSPAQEAGVAAGDAITSVDGEACGSWTDILAALDATERTEDIPVTFVHDGEERASSITPAEDGTIGIEVSRETVRLNPVDSARVSVAYVAQTASGVAQLLVPSRTMEVLDNSTSVVGISAMAAEAASAGPSTYLAFAGLISLSLGFMNLLPIPPLDGGKLLIEAIQAVSRRRVPMRVQTAISYVGVALFGLLFIYMLRADILRLL